MAPLDRGLRARRSVGTLGWCVIRCSLTVANTALASAPLPPRAGQPRPLSPLLAQAAPRYFRAALLDLRSRLVPRTFSTKVFDAVAHEACAKNTKYQRSPLSLDDEWVVSPSTTTAFPHMLTGADPSALSRRLRSLRAPSQWTGTPIEIAIHTRCTYRVVVDLD